MCLDPLTLVGKTIFSLMLAFVVATSALAANTIPIIVEVRLNDTITGHWASGGSDEVTGRLAGRLGARLNREYPHWTFTGGDAQMSPVTFAASVHDGGRNEVLLRVGLRITGGPRQTVLHLGDTVLYRPGHFDSFGRPTPGEAEARVWNSLESLLDQRREVSFKTLAERVPVARNPSLIQVPERTVVLPLPKGKYEHLGWSTFRLLCRQGPADARPAELKSEASNEWGPYDPNLPLALKVTVVDDVPEPRLRNLEPVLVFLERYVEKTDWLFVDDHGIQR